MKRNKTIEKECPCGKIFKTYQILIDEGKGKFCSKKCMYEYRKERKASIYTIHKQNNGWFKKGEIESNRARHNVPIICGVYKITNPKSEVYIGGSRTIYKRWLRHREARKNIPIHRSIKNYGWRSHLFEVVHALPNDVDGNTLLKYEQIYIDQYKECGMSMLNVKEAGSAGKKMK